MTPDSAGPDIPNREGDPAYDVTWPWRDGPLKPGLTCVFRVKNEARNLPWVLPPMFQAVQHIVLVDNLSDDGTGQVGHDVAQECGALDRYTGLSYPFRVSRAGAEHRETAADSVHSLTHFYNWSFGHVRTAYSMKWDGDMVLTADGVSALRDLSWQLEGSEVVVVVPRHPLTVVDERTGWLDLGKSYLEPWIYPMGPDYTFVKAFEWEVREWPETAERIVLPDGLAVELKWLDADEFAHWTDPSQFNAQRSPRKLREWQVDRAIREGRPGDIDGLVEVVAPPGVHIVDHVVNTWLPRAERPLVGRARPRAVASVATGQAAAGPGRSMDPLEVALRNAAQPVLGLVHPDCAHLAPRLPEGSTVVQLPTESVPDTGRWGTIVLIVPDRDALQRAVARLPATRATRNVGVFLEYADEVVTLAPRDDWPRMTMMSTRRDRHEYVTVARFSNWMAGKAVLSEFARQAVQRGLTPHTGLRVGVHGGAVAPPGEVHAIRLDELDAASDAGRDVPPDVIVTDQADISLKEHHVTGRAPVVVDESSGALAIGALEQRILNPIGFDRSVTEPVGTLTSADGGPRLRLPGVEIATTATRGATEEMVRSVRPHLGVEVAWPGASDLGFARTVAGLAMAGVPLLGDSPGWARGFLGDDVGDALATPVDLADELAREEHSIVLRRAALGQFSMPAWRARVAGSAGLRPPYQPKVSVVAASKRAENMEHLVAQVARQRGLEIELVYAPHGFDPDPARVAELAGPHVHTVVRPHPADTLFGDVLAGAVEAASGDLVLKMDDDDWYGPDFVADLLLARDYSGADLVGMPAEYLYLEPIDTTVRRNDASEEFGRFVAGGTMMISRATLRELGSFRPVRRYVDASLLADLLAAGGSVFRTQGLGYLFRRGESGHTWQADLDFFLDPERLRSKWDGFRPSRLLGLE